MWCVINTNWIVYLRVRLNFWAIWFSSKPTMLRIILRTEASGGIRMSTNFNANIPQVRLILRILRTKLLYVRQSLLYPSPAYTKFSRFRFHPADEFSIHSSPTWEQISSLAVADSRCDKRQDLHTIRSSCQTTHPLGRPGDSWLS